VKHQKCRTYETNRSAGSTAEVDFWTSRDVREVVRSHVNYVVADTKRWEQSAAYLIDTHPDVEAFVKNAGLGFAIPYLHSNQPPDYVPDFLIRLKSLSAMHLILETKAMIRSLRPKSMPPNAGRTLSTPMGTMVTGATASPQNQKR